MGRYDAEALLLLLYGRTSIYAFTTILRGRKIEWNICISGFAIPLSTDTHARGYKNVPTVTADSSDT